MAVLMGMLKNALKRHRQWSLCLLLNILFVPAALAIGPVMLSDGNYRHKLGEYIAVLKVAADDAPVNIQSRDVQLRFEPNHSDDLRLGDKSSEYWLRLSIHNPFREAHSGVVTLENARLLEAVLFGNVSNDRRSNDQPSHYQHSRNGHSNDSLTLLSDPNIYDRQHALLINVAGLTTNTYLLKVTPSGFQSSSITLSNSEEFRAEEKWRFTRNGLIIGWLLATSAYFLYLFFSRASRFAGFSALHSVMAAAFVANESGMLAQMLSMSPITKEMTSGLLVGISIASLFAAARTLDWSGERANLMRQVLSWSAALVLLVNLVFSIFCMGTSNFYHLIFTLGCLYSLTALLTFGSTREQRPRYWFLAGTCLASFGITALLLTQLNVIDMISWSYLLSVLLPMIIACTLVLVSFELDSGRNRPLESINRGITVSPAMLSQIGHELRTPINGVLGMNELLADTPLSESQRDFTETIAHAGREMLHVANEISVLAKIQDDHLELDTRSFDLVNLLNKCLSHFQLEANRKQIELVVDHSEDLPVRVLGDRNRLQTLLHNLYAHLLSHAERGEVRTHVSPQSGKSGVMESVSIQIHLHGSFTNRDDLRVMVDQLAHNDKPAEGQSWNLSVTQRLLRYMKASIELESIGHQDAAMTLYVPMAAEKPENMPATGSEDSLIGMSVLIVDDNASLRKVIDKQIRRWGIRVDSTHSGKEALAMMRNMAESGQPYDAAIVDQDMPGMNGLELMQRLNDDDNISPKPSVLMLTGLSISSVRESAHAVGIYHLLGKPASGERLKRALLELKYRPDRPSSLSD
ncbi:hybrid sensor histidine kinase/response regulator [Oceanobacter kriegii]|uniref:hybrid sensor histidine kinase/response regulator n=1 Tax=Oceanobacter kriegii TaxID=64972 RepID=UPI00040AF984|nr:response regulator [Oceanobacter kriegii]